MESHTLRPYVVVICLMAVTSLALAFTVDTNITQEAGIRMELPDTVGDWEGTELRFCQSSDHQATFLVSSLEDANTCPDCGESLKSMSKMEADILPGDTRMLKKQYFHPSGRTINASIVLSGKERGSIHRPEVCQTGQGQNLVGKSVFEVPIAGRDPLKVMVLELERKQRTQDGNSAIVGLYYAYWFVGKDRETPHHHLRMFWMAADRVLRNVSHRWAYVSISGARILESEEYRKEIKRVVGELYPHMSLDNDRS